MKKYAVIGLGYVGLGLAVALGKDHAVVGYDTNECRVRELQNNTDRNQQIDSKGLANINVTYTAKIEDTTAANFFIVSVSTPAYFYEIPDLDPLAAGQGRSKTEACSPW